MLKVKDQYLDSLVVFLLVYEYDYAMEDICGD